MLCPFSSGYNLPYEIDECLIPDCLQQHGILEEKIPLLGDIWDQQQGYFLFLIPANRYRIY